MAENNLTAENNRDNLIGSAIISSGFETIVADEAVLGFFGADKTVDLSKLIHPDDNDIARECIEKCADAPAFAVCRFKRADGVYVKLAVMMRSEEKNIAMDMFDIAYLTRQYEKFVASNKIFNELITMSDKIFFRYESKSNNIYVYNGREVIFDGDFGDYRKDVLDSNLVAAEDTDKFIKFCDDVQSGEEEDTYTFCAAFFGSGDDKKYYPMTASFSAVRIKGAVSYIVGMFSSDAESNAADSYISNRSNLDPLTGLLNKKASKDFAIEALVRAEKENKKVTFVMIDLDNFKSINDTYGHMFGDETLVSVARVMNEAVGNRGVVGRIGGDEFFIVLTDFEDGDQAIRPLIRSIRSHVEWCFKNKLDDIRVTCSVGTATFPDDAKNYDDLFKLADHCLYVAKSKGRDRFIIYTKEMHGTLEEIISSGTVVQMANFISEAHKSKHLLSVIQRFNSARAYDVQQIVLKKVMLELLYYYDIDGIQYCPFDENKPCCEVTSYKVTNHRALVESYEGYKDEINKKGYLTIGSYENAEKEHKIIYGYMASLGIYSMMIIKDVDVNGDCKGLFVITTYKRYQKWASFDINMLLVLCRLMEKFVR